MEQVWCKISQPWTLSTHSSDRAAPTMASTDEDGNEIEHNPPVLARFLDNGKHLGSEIARRNKPTSGRLRCDRKPEENLPHQNR
ncbi:hypothetical protein ACMD2_26319 [Ananas comosus]|uniref:Uncharacterized protein n=1 Tax=Ananas comosus TaxID=4615 RepID=A0A199VX75_ANACO|nr:hypothetical protein ACMD2_26319 [Ananas comosus]